MKQVWIGVGILAVLFLGGLWIGDIQEEVRTEQVRHLEQAQKAAMEENWSLASAHLTRAKKDWEQRRTGSEILYRQDPLDQIDGLFARLEAQLACRDRSVFCDTCALLAQNLQDLPQSHGFRWRNLL